MKRTILFLGLLITFLNISFAQNEEIVLKTDFNGQVEYGSIDVLISKIQQGKAIRIGWQLDFDNDGKSDLEHWIEANFISILNGHVFNQIEPIYRQFPRKEIPQIQIIDSNMQWTAIIGTNGKLISRSIVPDLHLIEDETVRKKLEKSAAVKEKIVATIWAVKH